MSGKGLLVLNRLRRGIQKVMFLLTFNATKWFIPSPGLSRFIRYKDQPSLMDSCITDDEYYEVASSLCVSRTSSSASEISRTISSTSNDDSQSSGDDIDMRAEVFIANFYKHIQMEREVSLKLRYCEGSDGLQRTKSA
ncbi:hypothetical protein J5N97_003421 [Dioscorea zingiberensis]|uniref:Uncharacterized protein n=1 Tax=Dioscorea zingiberensis TaxID=325984 RepID=A0A9D5HQ25_9LILI|nr:hypothetical protein J5N97_003421 [Dioscorea zingiberensis]